MANSTIQPGFMGQATIDGQNVRITSCNICAKQDMLFYTHTIGLNDSGFTGSKTKGETVGEVQPQKIVGRPSPLNIGGSISFPVFDGFQDIFDNVRKGNYFDIDVQYTCGIARSFKRCRCNGIDFSVTAGEYANATLDVLALEEDDTSTSNTNLESSKLLTWDNIIVSVNGDGIDLRTFQGISFKVNNAASYIYTAKSAEASIINPRDLRLGTQDVTGSVSAYIGKGHEYIKTTATVGSVKISSEWFTTSMSVMFKSDSIESQIGPIVITVPFVGVDKVFA